MHTNQNITPITLAIALVLCTMASAFPPAPHHEIYGTVRDDKGNPLSEAKVRIIGSQGTLLSGPVDQSIAPGVNYSMKIPMDAGTQSQLYQSTALRPSMPYTAEVIMNGVSYLPIEVSGGGLAIGEPGKRTRLDLTLGVDSDGDGLPDAWENDLIAALSGVNNLSDVTKDGDSDGDGVSNFIEYLAGTYAFDRRAVFRLDIVEVKDGMARMRFLAVKGRSYTLKSSTDLKTFVEEPFSLEADSAETQTAHLAQQIRYQDIYVPADQIANQTFRLHVQ